MQTARARYMMEDVCSNRYSLATHTMYHHDRHRKSRVTRLTRLTILRQSSTKISVIDEAAAAPAWYSTASLQGTTDRNVNVCIERAPTCARAPKLARRFPNVQLRWVALNCASYRRCRHCCRYPAPPTSLLAKRQPLRMLSLNYPICRKAKTKKKARRQRLCP